MCVAKLLFEFTGSYDMHMQTCMPYIDQYLDCVFVVGLCVCMLTVEQCMGLLKLTCQRFPVRPLTDWVSWLRTAFSAGSPCFASLVTRLEKAFGT